MGWDRATRNGPLWLLIINRVPKYSSERVKFYSTNSTGHQHSKKANLAPYLAQYKYTKNKLRKIIDLNIIVKNIKLLEENIINYFDDVDPRK